MSFPYQNVFAALCLLVGCGRCDRNVGPPREAIFEPTPLDEAADQTPTDVDLDPARRAVAEQFADMLVLRYRVTGFDRLTLRERKLAYYLQQASLSGRDIVYDQRFRHNLAVRRTLEAVIQTYRGDRSTEAYAGVVQYAKRVFFANGIHHPVSGAPMRPLRLTASEFAVLVQDSDASKLPLGPGQSVAGWIATLTPLLFGTGDAHDPDAAPLEDDPLAGSHTHLYLDVTANEVTQYYAAPTAHGPLHPLNSRLRKRKGGIVEEVYKQDGLYGEALREVVHWLRKAREVAGDERQVEALTHLARYYETGDPQEFEAYSEAYNADARSAVDVLHGFLDTGYDPLGIKGTFGALVSLDDHAASERLQALVRHAQWFEDHAPIDPAYRRSDTSGLTARALDVVISAGSHAPILPVGAHLPQGSDVHVFGCKGITLNNVLHAQAQARLHTGMLGEFILHEREERRARAHGAQALALLAGLHEVIGHSAGRLGQAVPPASLASRRYAATIEEARADLYALYFLFDPKLIELGLMSTFEVARAGYDAYVRHALLLSLQALDQDAPIEDPRVSAARLVVDWARARDPLRSPVIQRVLREGETFFVITDYLKLRRYFGELLAELQRITSEGDHGAARKLVMKHATRVEQPLYEQVRRRRAALQLPTSVGFLQPRLIAESDGDAILDVSLHYPADFLTQQLEDSGAFSFLPTYTD